MLLSAMILLWFGSVVAQNEEENMTDSTAVSDSVGTDSTADLYAHLPKDDQCISCHIEEEAMPEGFDPKDIHMKEGLSCAGCHGGDNSSNDEDEAMNEDIGFIGAPDKADIPQMCGKCHSDINIMRKYNPQISTDQVSQYFQSMHGRKLKEGDENVATCNDCHTAHSIMKHDDPRSTVYALNVPKTCNHCHGDEDYMEEYDIPTDQYEKYAQSVHGKALLEREDTGAPACNDCHGNHGATPPDVTSLVYVCGSCHVQNEQFFKESKMAHKWEEKQDKHFCVECHGNHDVVKPTDDFVGTQKGEAICVKCHKQGEKGYMIADTLHTLLKRATAAYDTASALKEKVLVVGMNDVEIDFLLQDAHQAIVHARTTVHTFDPTKVREKTDEALKNAHMAIELGKKELDDYDFRRMGLGVATLIITLLAIALYIKIRDIEKGQNL